MISDDKHFILRLAQDDRDLRAAQRLRYEVFVQELGATVALADHDARLERDSESEFDLTALKASGRKLLELGRSCVHADYRGGTAMLLLWNALADYVLEHGIEVLFGAASFHGTDMLALAQPLSYLQHFHLAPPELRVIARPVQAAQIPLIPQDGLDRKAAMLATPALIKAYLRLGGYVGQGAWVDHAFNTTDVCLVMDTAQMSAKHRDFYIRKSGREA